MHAYMSCMFKRLIFLLGNFCESKNYKTYKVKANGYTLRIVREQLCHFNFASLLNWLDGTLSLPRKSVVRLTDRPDMTLAFFL